MTIKLLQWQLEGVVQIISIDVSTDDLKQKHQEFLKIANDLNFACVKCGLRSITWVEVEG